MDSGARFGLGNAVHRLVLIWRRLSDIDAIPSVITSSRQTANCACKTQGVILLRDETSCRWQPNDIRPSLWKKTRSPDGATAWRCVDEFLLFSPSVLDLAVTRSAAFHVFASGHQLMHEPVRPHLAVCILQLLSSRTLFRDFSHPLDPRRQHAGSVD